MDDFAHARLAEEDPRNPFDLKVLVLYALARFRNQIIALGILGVIAGLIAGAAQPNSYAVMSRLRLNESVRLSLSEESIYGADGVDPARVRMSSAIFEELELLKDPIILERTVEKFGAEYILTVADPRAGDGDDASLPVKFMHGLQAGLIHLKGLDDPCPEGDTPEAIRGAVERLKANLTVGNQRNTNIIDVKYTDSSPARAKKIGDEIVVQMRTRHREEYAAVGSLERLQENLELALQEFQKTQEELLAYKDQCGFKDLPNDLAATNAEINLNETLRAQKKIELGRLNKSVKSIERDLKISASEETVDESSMEQMRINPKYQQIAARMGELQRARDEHVLQFGGGDETLVTGIRLSQLEDLDRQISAQRRELDSIDPYVSKTDLDAIGIGLSEEFGEVIALLYEQRGAREGLIEEVNGIEEYLGELRRRQRSMEECAVEYEANLSRFELAKKKKGRLQEQELFLTGLASMDSDDRTNLTLFRGSILPSEKEGPQRSKPLLMGLVGGLVLGAGVGVLRQLLDRRVRYEETVENSLGLRVLCVVSDLGGKPGFSKRQSVA